MARSLLRCLFLLVLPLTVPSVFADSHVPKVALVLSGGGARGGAHIGVLRALARAGVPIDLIVGTSYGALVGGLYAAGYSTGDIERVVSAINWDDVTDDRPDRRLLNLNRKSFDDGNLIALRMDRLEPRLPRGVFSGQKIQQLLDRLTTPATYRAGNDFDRLPVPFRAVATDILTGEPYVFQSGTLSRAIRASLAVPGLFTPVEADSTLLVDGGIADNLPVDIARAEGADFVIAVDCATPLRTRKGDVRNLIDILDQAISFRIEEKKIENRRLADVLITPDLKDFDAGDFDQAPTLVALGEAAANAQMAAIQRGLQKVGRPLQAAEKRPGVLPTPFAFDRWPGPAQPVVIDSVRFEGLTHYAPEHLCMYLRIPIGRPVPVQMLDRDVSALYATGMFETVGYRLLRNKAGATAVFTVRETGRSELGLGAHYDQDFQMVGLAQFVRRHAFVQGLDVYARGGIGKLSFVDAGFYSRPLPKLSTRLIAQIHAHDTNRPVYENGVRRDDEQEHRYRMTLGLQHLFGNWGSVRSGYAFAHVHIRNGLSQMPDVSEGAPAFWADAEVDTRDRTFLPESGMHAQAVFQWIDRPSDYRRLLVSFAQSVTLAPTVVLDASGFWGYVDTSAPFYDALHVGGAGHFSFAALRFPGLNRAELRVTHMASGALRLRKRFDISPIAALNGVSVGLIYQAGVYNGVPDTARLNAWIHGYGAGVYLNRRFPGPMCFEVAGTSRKTLNFYAAIGYAF